MSTKPVKPTKAPAKKMPPPPASKKDAPKAVKPAPVKTKAIVETFPTGSDIAMAALDINTLLDPENQIDSSIAVGPLTDLVKEAAEAVVRVDDKLQDDTWKVLKALGVGPRKNEVEEPEPETDTATEVTKAAGKPAKADKPEKTEKHVKTEGTKRPGVITAVEEILKSGKFTLKEITAKLVAKFPGRPEKGLHHTAYSQVYTPPETGTDWSTLRTKRNLTIHTNKDGQYWIGKGK